ncbi:hypothetical protein TanjilG_05180 [Lupinus angustifolius]|uniref:MATH domain-containing protein n=1 Tax=Lupinus angustifolius TaxID=3871 RepID=A0A394DE37_LUPAN|nr:hypothetical protein TanjilG_05180 [Lupinus angustifolius]
MKNHHGTRINLEKFTWEIESFSKNTKKLESKPFKIGGCKWKISMNPIGKRVGQLSLCLEVSDTQRKFNKGYRIWGLSFINLIDFCNPEEGYLMNDKCIVEAHIYVSDDEFNTNIQNENLNNIVATNGSTSGKQEIESSDESERHSSTTCESSQRGNNVQGSDFTLRHILDFEKLREEEKTYVPLLVKVCTLHPSLIRSQKKKPDLFKEWAFISLGKVLHFLNTTKARDMNEDACNQLCILWDELINKCSGFDLTWLEPHVHNALGVKAQLERSSEMKTLQNSVVAMEIKMLRLRGELAATEAEFKVASKALIEAREGFTEMDFDVALDYELFR